MYFWKCWRESRRAFIVGVVVTVVLCGLSTLYTAKIGVPALDHAGAHPTNPTAAQVWAYVARMNLGAFGGLMALFWGLVLGSKGLGKEFEDKTAEFLFTRPRRRRYWVWAGWPAGVMQLAIIVFAAGASTCGALVFLAGSGHAWRLMATLPSLVVASAAGYGFAYLLAVVTRSGRQALIFAIGLLFIAAMLPGAGHYWHMHLPSLGYFNGRTADWAAGPLHPVPFEGGFRWTDVGPSHPFPFEAAVLWTIAALVFPLVSQLVVEKAQV